MEEKKPFSWAILSSFILKILALVFMTIDHVGAMLEMYGIGPLALTDAFRYIGRLALPLFCFMIAEGMKHTKKPGQYFLRLGIIGTAISIAMVVIEYAPIFDGMSLRRDGNIFMDLLLGALAIYLLSNKKWYLKILTIFPVAFSVLSFIVTSIEEGENILIHWFPFFLRMQYHCYSMAMIILFYLVKYPVKWFLQTYSTNSGIPVESLEGTNVERYSANIFSTLVVVVTTLSFFLIQTAMPQDYVFWDWGFQNFAMIGGAFLLLYSGKRGYNAKWFQYGCYLYYPLHLILIYVIGMLIF